MKNTTCLIATLAFCHCASAADAPLTPAAASEKVGEQCSVEMKVVGIADLGDLIMNCDDNFFVVISKDAKEQFAKADIKDIQAHFKDSRVRVTGTVTLYELQNKKSGAIIKLPCIRVTKPDQIKIVTSETK